MSGLKRHSSIACQDRVDGTHVYQRLISYCRAKESALPGFGNQADFKSKNWKVGIKRLGKGQTYSVTLLW